MYTMGEERRGCDNCKHCELDDDQPPCDTCDTCPNGWASADSVEDVVEAPRVRRIDECAGCPVQLKSSGVYRGVQAVRFCYGISPGRRLEDKYNPPSWCPCRGAGLLLKLSDEAVKEVSDVEA